MITAEFHTKPETADYPTALKRLPAENETPIDVPASQPLSLLINFTLHGRLTDSDREWLDSLASDSSICFLIHGERYLHPEDTPLFPIEMLESSMLPCGSSVFSQRFSTKDSPNLATHRILSTLVGTIGGVPLRFGLFGRENQVSDQGLELSFSDSVVALREAAASLVDLNQRILPELRGTEPCCVLDRSVGKVMAANQAFADLIDTDAPGLSGRSFEELASDYPRQFADNRLVIQNTSVARWPMSVVIIGETTKTVPIDNISRFFFHKIRNRLSAITTSASYLQSLAPGTWEDDEASLIAVISSESALLNDELDRFEFVNQYSVLPTCSQSIVAELRRAQKNVAPETEWTFSGAQLGQKAAVDAPDGALYRLFEAVFKVHSQNAPSGTIVYGLDSSPSRLRIEIVSHTSDRNTVNPTYWTTYLRHLCGLLGVGIDDLAKTNNDDTVSTLTLSISQDQP